MKHKNRLYKPSNTSPGRAPSDQVETCRASRPYSVLFPRVAAVFFAFLASLALVGLLPQTVSAAPSYMTSASSANVSSTTAAATPASFNRDDQSPALKLEVAKIIYAYKNRDQAQINELMVELKEQNPEYAQIMSKILTYWDWIETKMVRHLDGVPSGLQNVTDPAHHAFIVLGYALAPDGTMRPELIGRLQTALQAFETYPQAYFVVTGGVPQNGHTEGELMRKWLIEHGVPDAQIIPETTSADTAGNAEKSFTKLYLDYKINSASVITSGYHLKRGTLLLYAESLFKAAELGRTPIAFLGEFNSGWKRPDLDDETLGHRAATLSQIAHVFDYYKAVERSEEPADTKPGLYIRGTFDYEAGDAPALQALFRTPDGKLIDVTKETQFPGIQTIIDQGVSGIVKASYVYNGTTYTSNVAISSHNKGWHLERLKNKVAEVQDFSADWYTPASYSSFAAALKHAKAAIADKADSKTAEKAFQELSAAIVGLQKAQASSTPAQNPATKPAQPASQETPSATTSHTKDSLAEKNASKKNLAHSPASQSARSREPKKSISELRRSQKKVRSSAATPDTADVGSVQLIPLAASLGGALLVVGAYARRPRRRAA